MHPQILVDARSGKQAGWAQNVAEGKEIKAHFLDPSSGGCNLSW